MKIGPFQLSSQLLAAPMAGITDRPFRKLCRDFGAGLATSEMISSDPSLKNSRKSTLRRITAKDNELEPVSIQIAGTDPQAMAQAAAYNVDQGAQIIDINMGCPAKKVCNKLAGSALMKDEALVADILKAVKAAVDVPVTLKIRTGWDRQNKNALNIARIAEAEGIAMLAVHGRTREDLYKGEAEYDTIAEIKRSISIPLVANGDINSPQKAAEVLKKTGADGLMIGRAAQGKPWIFQQINHYLENNTLLAEPAPEHIHQLMTQHLEGLYHHYGEVMGPRIARKHVGWYLAEQPFGSEVRRHFNQLQTTEAQQLLLTNFFQALAAQQLAPWINSLERS